MGEREGEAMRAEDFITECEGIFDKQLKPAQIPIYKDKLRRFSPQQLLEILNKVLEEAKYFPKVSEIYKAAQELGFLQQDRDDFRAHRWRASDCRLCKGEGRLCVTWLVTSEIQNEQRVEVHALSRIIPYVESCDSKAFTLQKGEFRSLFRCSCLAGEAVTIPKSWPQWSRNIPAVRYF